MSDDSIRSEIFAYGAVRFLIVDAAGTEIATPLRTALPAVRSLPFAGCEPDVCYAIDHWRPGLDTGASGYRITRNGALRYLGRTLEQVATWLRTDLDELAARRRDAHVVVKAAAIAWHGRAILILGDDGSALLTELVRLGASLCADELVRIDVEGRIVATVSTSKASLPIALIISTTHRPNASWSPRRLTGVRAVLPILERASTSTIEPGHLLHGCAHIAAAALTLQGPYSEAPSAAQQILAALDAWIDGCEQAPPQLVESPSLWMRACDALGRARGRSHLWPAQVEEQPCAAPRPMQPG